MNAKPLFLLFFGGAALATRGCTNGDNQMFYGRVELSLRRAAEKQKEGNGVDGYKQATPPGFVQANAEKLKL